MPDLPFVTADQLVAHAVGDYLLQSDWMATEKTRRSFAAAVHAVAYTVPFLFLTTEARALAIIASTHFVIDRWRLARYVVWVKNWLGRRPPPWRECSATGYAPDKPAWLAVWLLIIADNICHILINAAALRWCHA
jgi:hypothetical protein